MLTLNKTNDLILGSIWGENFSIPFTETKYDAMSKLKKKIEKADNTKKEIDSLIEDFKKYTQVSITESLSSELSEFVYNPNTRRYHFKGEIDGEEVISSIPVPHSLMGKILDANVRGFDVNPMIKFWVRLLKNPNINTSNGMRNFSDLVCNYISKTYVDRKLENKLIAEGLSKEVAEERATLQQTPFTTEGLICTKKVVAHEFDITEYEWKLIDNVKTLVKKDGLEDVIDPISGEVTKKQLEFIAENQVYSPYIHKNGDKFLSGNDMGYIYRVGLEARLDSWDKVNCNSNDTCSKGLHTGNQDYIKGFERAETSTLNCFVDPRNIGAVSDGEDVLRVIAFFPHSIKDREETNSNYYFASEYAKQSDARWATEKAEAIDKFKLSVEYYKDFVDERIKTINAKIEDINML